MGSILCKLCLPKINIFEDDEPEPNPIKTTIDNIKTNYKLRKKEKELQQEMKKRQLEREKRKTKYHKISN